MHDCVLNFNFCVFNTHLQLLNYHNYNQSYGTIKMTILVPLSCSKEGGGGRRPHLIGRPADAGLVQRVCPAGGAAEGREAEHPLGEEPGWGSGWVCGQGGEGGHFRVSREGSFYTGGGDLRNPPLPPTDNFPPPPPPPKKNLGNGIN